MECYKIENLNFKYPNNSENALCNINITINSGEFVLLCGKSGCGKTTLLRLLKHSLAPCGKKSGNIYFYKDKIDSLTADITSSKIGYVMQNIESQIVTDKVWHELAFGLESLRIQNDEIRTRVSEMAEYFGISDWFYKNVSELSGGQKQILNLASIMVMRPDVLILDEPTSQLDPIAAYEFLKTTEKINRELGTTVILSEHRLEEAFAIADRVILMDKGMILADATPNGVGKILNSFNHPMCRALPTPMRVANALGADKLPLTVRDGRIWLEEYAKNNEINPGLIKDCEKQPDDKICIEVKNVRFRYDKDLPDVIKGLSMTVKKGEFQAIVGGNGTGKSTALSLICGNKKPQRGKISVLGRCAMLPQNPQILFTENTVEKDLVKMTEDMDYIAHITELCELNDLLDRHPYDLSGGELQRGALAKILLLKPDILLLDEPTKGLDADFKDKLADILSQLTSMDITILMVSHDIEFCAEHADRCSMFFDGAITSTQTPQKMFSANTFYTTSASRMAKTVIPDAVLAEDIILACGGSVKKSKDRPEKTVKLSAQDKTPPKKPDIKKKKKPSKASIISSIFALIAVPLTILFGIYFLDDRKYYFISLLIILEVFVPFFVSFDNKKPNSRELVIISVLCAIAVCGRMACYMIPQFKPVMAIVIISGVALGGEAGFLVGALSAFVSNFFFGQGPWTPWQMFSFGTVGCLSGLLFYNRSIKKKRTVLSVFGFLATIIIYGGIINPSSVLITNSIPTMGAILSSYAMGFPFDLIHAVSTMIFLWLVANPITEKLERIKIKYDIR